MMAIRSKFTSGTLCTAFLLICGLLLTAGCSQEQTTDLTDSGESPAEKTRVVCSTFPMYLITKNVTNGWENGEVELLIAAELGCPHDYALTPQNMQTLADADVMVINGLGMEEFLGKPVERANAEIITIDSSAAVSEYLQYEAECCDDHGHDHDHHHHDHEDHEHSHSGDNPHLFASPRLAGKMAGHIADQLAELAPADAELFAANAQSFQAEMEQLMADFVAAARGVTNNRIVTQHGIFDYLARDIGLEIVAVVQAHGGKDPAAAEMLEIVETIRQKNAVAVFTEPQYPGRVAETIATEADILVAELDPVASGPKDASMDYYQRAMRQNVETLRRVLGSKE